VTALTAANARIGALVRAVLILEYPLPVPTTAVAERVSWRYDPAVYRALARMEHQGDVEKISVPDDKSRYWRLATPPATTFLPARPVPGQAGSGPVRPRSRVLGAEDSVGVRLAQRPDLVAAAGQPFPANRGQAAYPAGRPRGRRYPLHAAGSHGDLTAVAPAARSSRRSRLSWISP